MGVVETIELVLTAVKHNIMSKGSLKRGRERASSGRWNDDERQDTDLV